MGKRKSHKPNNNSVNNKRKRKRKNKKNKKNKNKDKKNKIVFHGINGEKYNEEGEKNDLSDEEEEEINDNEINLFVETFLNRIKNNSKTQKAKEYLNNFKKKKWKFNKNIQIFILKYILFNEVFENEYFEIFKEYIVNMFKDTKNKFIKNCENYINLYKDAVKDETKMTFKLGKRELKFGDIERKNSFFTSFNNRCVEIIENN